MRRLALLVAACLFMVGAAQAQAQAPRVVVTLKPLHSIVAGVMEGVGTPALLVSGAASEHTYTLKPSDARAVADADLVVLVDDSFETWLRRPLANRKDKAGILRLMGAPGVITLRLRQGGVWESDEHDHGHSHGNERAGLDGHIWLDSRNGQAIARAVGAALSRIDPARGSIYATNAAKVADEIAAVDQRIAADLAPLRDKPFIVFHDAYQYFEARYGLAAAGSITVDPERQPGARRIADIRARIADRRALCLFREPQFTPALVDMLVQGSEARSGELDPIGAAIPAGPGAYAAILRNLSSELQTCLSGAS